LLGAATLAACDREPPAGVITTEAGWIDLTGYRQRLAAEKGRVVVVNFWATWCEPCREEFPELVRFDRRYAGRGVTFLSVSLDSPRDRDTAVRKFLAEQRPAFPVFLKNDRDDPDAFINGVDPQWMGELPATILYDRAGARRRSLFGPQSLADLEAAVRPLL
jgi:thiol-disulfide isomerase/thioredoxin